MIKCLLVLGFRIVGIFLVILFLLVPIFKQLFKLCFKRCKSETKDLIEFIEKEKDN